MVLWIGFWRRQQFYTDAADFSLLMHYRATGLPFSEEIRRMEYTALVLLAALGQYLYFTVRVGAARPRYGVDAPRCSGDETWERLFRVQQNTLEQLIVFIPALLLFGFYVSGKWVVVPGLLYLVGRQLYAYEYVSNPKSRGPGMGLTLLAEVVLAVGALVGVVLNLV
jgi:glutathione S-transferase